MKVRILGTAAGGGYPQWNCACGSCAYARKAGIGRRQDTVAVRAENCREWFLLNASPDLPAQIADCPDLAPGPGRRETPLRGIILSTAELDHLLGLPTLREAESLTVIARPTVLTALPFTDLLAPYTQIEWRAVATGELVPLRGGLLLQVATVGAKPPRYAVAPGEGWVSALRLTDPSTGGVLVYASCLPAWTPEFEAFAAGATALLLDGTFFTDDEMTRATGQGRPARAMGHLPIADSLPHLRDLDIPLVRYTHINNTNPLLIDDGELSEHGAALAADGELLEL